MAETSGSIPPIRVRRNRGVDVVITTRDGTVVVVHPFPEDAHVAADIERVATRLAAVEPRLTELREELEATLRAWYPRIAIRPREELATLSHAEHVWYAMRDGHVHTPDARLDRLHAAMATARDTREDANDAIARARDIVGAVARRRGESAMESAQEADEHDAND